MGDREKVMGLYYFNIAGDEEIAISQISNCSLNEISMKAYLNVMALFSSASIENLFESFLEELSDNLK